jgi:hypothetical protein
MSNTCVALESTPVDIRDEEGEEVVKASGDE